MTIEVGEGDQAFSEPGATNACGPDIRWPIIHHAGLANTYQLLLEHRHVSVHFNASAQEGVRVRDITSFFAGGAGVSVIPGAEARKIHGEAALGPMLD